MTLPLIALPADTINYDGYRWQAGAEQYLIAAREVAQTTPIILPSLDIMDMSEVLNHIDGVLITGAKSNVQPCLYGKSTEPDSGPFDFDRDTHSLNLIRKAIEHEIPLLAICRGIQELNVALGGTLANNIQNIAGRLDHRARDTEDPAERFAIHQQVNLAQGGYLHNLFQCDCIKVNSAHQQAIDSLAPALTIEATALDGTIEAVSVKHAKAFSLGLQWHPEFWAQTDPYSRAIFESFGQAVHQHHQAR